MIALEHLHHLLDWAARNKLDKGKGHKKNSQQRGNHEQKTLNDIAQKIGAHGFSHHQAAIAQSSEW